MEQLTLDNMSEGQLGDGANIKPGDLLKWINGPYQGFTRAILHDGALCMERYMFGTNKSIHEYISSASYCRVEKVTLTEMYKFCKENGWDTAKHMKEFGRKKTT